MSKKRMFSKDIVLSDVFLDMPLSAQALYFHLSMEADDYGFVSPRRVMRSIGANDDDLKILVAKRYVLLFDNGVVVIKHWHINNTVRKDRSNETTYQKEFLSLTTNEFGAYTEIAKISEFVEVTTQETYNLQQSEVKQQGSLTNGQPLVAKRLPQIRLDKIRVVSTNVLVNSDEPNSRLQNRRLIFMELVKALGFSEKVKPTDGRLRKMQNRLKSYKPSELTLAAKNLGSDQYMQGDNDAGKRYGTIDYLLRSDEIVERYLLIEENANQTTNLEDLKKYA